MTAPPFDVRLASRALIRVAGPDWRSFLQGLLSNDVDGLAAGEARFAGLLSPQGRLLFDLIVIADADGALLDVEADRREAVIQRLSLYRLRAKVEIEPDGRPVAASNGPAAAGWIQDPRLPALGVRAYGPEAQGSVPDNAAYEAHRLLGIDFAKGCFVGQETTSRMHRRGKVKSRMLPLTFDGSPPPHGAEIMAGDLRAGEVLSGIDGRAMALMRLDRIEGAQLTVDGRSVRVERPSWFRP
jgi:tRNA-modifying protein YgfZ